MLETFANWNALWKFSSRTDSDGRSTRVGAHEHITDGNRFIERDFFKLCDFVIRGYVDPRWRSGKDDPAGVSTKAVSKETWDHLYRWFDDSTMPHSTFLE
jgi:hypothetical protein